MRRFLIKISIFVLPIAVVVLGVELYLSSYKSAFQTKAQYIKENEDKIECLVLGSSHNQNAINPEYIKNLNVANLAYSGQDLKLDFLLLKEFQHLPKLKIVIIELAYHGLENATSPGYDRNTIYLRFYKINNFDRTPRLLDYSIFLSNPGMYTSFLNPFMEKIPVNKYGFVAELCDLEKSIHRFKNAQYDTAYLYKTRVNMFTTRHNTESIDNFNNNTRFFENMIQMCLNHKLKVLVITPPLYKTYYELINANKKKRTEQFIARAKSKFPSIVYKDFSTGDGFSVYDFMNYDHLNPVGAEKFSKIIDSVLQNIQN